MDYEQKYKEAFERAKTINSGKYVDIPAEDTVLEYIFPELKESEDEKIRKALVDALNKNLGNGIEKYGTTFNAALAWLEKQGKETSWKPSKEEMDVLYGLAYITNQYDEHKEEVITRLYQDLKREFFNGSSYENMFPNTEDGVRRRNTIQVLEYARSLDTYNQFGKADIDKNIAWLEKQCEPTEINPSEFDSQLNRLLKQFQSLPKEELASSLSFYLNVVHNDGTYKEEKQGDTKKDIDDAYLEGICDAKHELKKQGEQEPTWSEEDKRILNRIYQLIAQAADEHAYSTTCRLIGDKECVELQDWLKSLKERMKGE